ncbi:hypothetical protein XELAEV_18001720mg [Xenopus laevis]|nr:hypothetical protein XELAEV_18001720mg [Xenopus laevis]
MRPTTQKLKEAQIPYRWGFPFKLIATRNGQQYVFSDASLGEIFLAHLGISKTPRENSPRLSPTKPPAWNLVSPKTGNQRSPGSMESHKTTSPAQSSRLLSGNRI